VLDRVARLYDGWLPFLPSAEAYGAAWRRLESSRAEAGRPEGAVTPGFYATITVGPDESRAKEFLPPHRFVSVGDEERWATHGGTWRDAYGRGLGTGRVSRPRPVAGRRCGDSAAPPARPYRPGTGPGRRTPWAAYVLRSGLAKQRK